MRKKTILLSVAMLSAVVSIAQNFTAVYDFTDVTTGSGLTDPTPVPVTAGLVFGKFSAIGTSANSNASGRFSFTGWPTGATTGDDSYASLTGSVNTSEYYEVTVGPEHGYTIDLTGITFSVQRSGTGIRTYVVRSSADGYASNLPASVNPANNKLAIHTGDIFFWSLDATTSALNGSTITLGGINFTGLSAPLTFRFYGYNSEGAAGTFSIDNVTFAGTANVTTSIDTHSKGTTNVYPNPSATGLFMVDVGTDPQETMITVSNILGKIIFTKEVNSSSENTIDISNEANGTYLITIKNDKTISTQRICINK